MTFFPQKAIYRISYHVWGLDSVVSWRFKRFHSRWQNFMRSMSFFCYSGALHTNADVLWAFDWDKDSHSHLKLQLAVHITLSKSPVWTKMSAVKKKNTNWSRKLLLCVSAGVDCWENPRGAVSYDHFRISVVFLFYCSWSTFTLTFSCPGAEQQMQTLQEILHCKYYGSEYNLNTILNIYNTECFFFGYFLSTNMVFGNRHLILSIRNII